MSLQKNVEGVKERIVNAQIRSGNTDPVEIIAITKTHSANLIKEALNEGIKSIGENRIQEADSKFSKIPDILQKLTKRLVGHLQSNKINKAMELFDTIDSIDSYKLASKVGERVLLQNQTLPILLEVNTSGESTKFGFEPDNIDDMMACFEIKGLNVQGLMTVGPLTSDKTRIRSSFKVLKKIFENIKSQTSRNSNFTEISMGMSSDFEIAVEEGATMVRLGTVLFGPRGVYK